MTEIAETSPSYKSSILADPFISSLEESHPAAWQRIKALHAELLGLLMRSGTPEQRPTSERPSSDKDRQLVHQIVEAASELYPRPIDPATLKEVLLKSDRIHAGYLSTITDDDALNYHLRLCAQLAARRDVPHPGADFGPPVVLQLPVVRDDFSTLYQLRRNEAVFSELRTALTMLSTLCAKEVAALDGPVAYDSVLGRHVDDIVGPARANLLAWEKRERNKKWGAKALGATLGLVLHVGKVPASGQIGRTLGNAAGKKLAATEQDAARAARILRSFS